MNFIYQNGTLVKCIILLYSILFYDITNGKIFLNFYLRGGAVAKIKRSHFHVFDFISILFVHHFTSLGVDDVVGGVGLSTSHLFPR